MPLLTPMDKIICVGKNYLDHAKELGDAVPEKPVLFLKPPSVLLSAKNWGDTVECKFPTGRGELHHECEIVLRVNQKLEFDAVTLGLDMTLRELQAKLKKNGHPWEAAKVFQDSAVVGPWLPLPQFSDYLSMPFSLSLNGKTRQQGEGRQMLYAPKNLLPYIAEHFPLRAGDLVFTGTPAGVGPVQKSDIATLSLNGQHSFNVKWI